MKPALYLATLILTSCATSSYYQVYKSTAEKGILSGNNILFEDENCRLLYNLWGEGGNVGFYIYNKTEMDLTLDLTKSFFVLNDISHEYFQNRIFSQSNSSGTSANRYKYFYSDPIHVASSISRSTSYEEKPFITIPPKTKTNVSEFEVSDSRYISCDLPKFPSRKTIKTITFDKATSPFVFYNLITYRIKSDTIRFENRFFVSEITNLPEKSAFINIYKSFCGTPLETPAKAFKDATPDKFYIKYIRDNSIAIGN
ncbi:MAG TPA: hypothetical protein VIM75_20720 [Ohtaekwangia sp.]|uniref:hypothetical protein n=1 Tax=Ohtaekwangia sp. TaxID=2066019 RepID=UPI002F9375D5